MRYNLFRRTYGTEVCCAIPEDRVVPEFIKGEWWTFCGKVDPASGQLGAWELAIVEQDVREKGYFLFDEILARLQAHGISR
jgi:hypothetical protein